MTALSDTRPNVSPLRSDRAAPETIEDRTNYVTETAEALMLLHGPIDETENTQRHTLSGEHVYNLGDSGGMIHLAFGQRLLAKLAGAEIKVTISISPRAVEGDDSEPSVNNIAAVAVEPGISPARLLLAECHPPRQAESLFGGSFWMKMTGQPTPKTARKV